MTACEKTTQSISTKETSYVTSTLQQAYFNNLLIYFLLSHYFV